MPRAERPTLLWDGDCAFCAHWIERWKGWTGAAVDYRPYQEALDDFPEVREDDCRRAVQLVLPDGRVFAAAHAVFQTLALAGRGAGLVRLYERSGLFRWCTEATYRFVAHNRGWLPKI